MRIKNQTNGVDDVRQENHCRESGFRVVIADFIAMSDEWQQVVDDIRNRLVDNADASSFGWAWGEVEGAPNLLDLASVLPRE
jgi:hypothetical protein